MQPIAALVLVWACAPADPQARERADGTTPPGRDSGAVVSDSGTTPTTGATTPETGDTGPSLPTSYRCVDLLDGRGNPGADGRPDFSDDVPLHVRAGLGYSFADCVFSPRQDIHLRFGCAGGWWMDACFTGSDVPPEVWVTVRLRLADEPGWLAGGDLDDRIGLALAEYDAAVCTGVGAGFGNTWRHPEEVCGWVGRDAILEIELASITTDRVGSARIRGAVVLEACGGGPYDCSRYTE